MDNCLFCKIINKEINSDIVFENDDFLVFKDIHPKADIHLLIVPKNHIDSVDNVKDDDSCVLGGVFLTARDVAKNIGVSGGYKLQINVGRDGGQEIDHIHVHLLAQKRKEVAME